MIQKIIKKKTNENYEKDISVKSRTTTEGNISYNEDLTELKNKNKELEEENILLRTELENSKKTSGDGESNNANEEIEKNYENLKQKYITLMGK